MCSWLVEHGHCSTKAEQMEELCPLSCNFCLNECTDLDPAHICGDIKRRGYCNYGGAYAARCTKTCGFCNEVSQSGKYTQASEEKIMKKEVKIVERVNEPCTDEKVSSTSKNKHGGRKCKLDDAEHIFVRI